MKRLFSPIVASFLVMTASAVAAPVAVSPQRAEPLCDDHDKKGDKTKDDKKDDKEKKDAKGGDTKPKPPALN
ncbi:MAG TPA: hypothetical protein VJN18_20440 [Polyangiaceae bacterium]|nr:hypothetical protein [Polyangiaceae bacterium]